MTWRKIAPCDAGACVEVRELPGVVEVRSSRVPERTVVFNEAEWEAFVAGLRATESTERGEVVGELWTSPVATTGGEDEGWTVLRDLTVALAGRLLPPVVQTREEWGVVSPTGDWHTYRTQAQAEDSLRSYRASWTRLGSPWPDVHVRVRTISTLADDGSPYGGATLIGKWRNVDE